MLTPGMLTRGASNGGRFAVYHAPPEGSALADLAARWLGRDATTGAPLERLAVPGLDPAQTDRLTAPPRFYGFHGTLKAPFALAAGTTAEDLIAAVDRVAAGRAAFTLPALRVEPLGGFLALTPSAPAPDLDALAAACVQTLDAFRAPPDADDLARRRAAGLTARQQAMLDRWGYPYVMEEFRFHMTLTGRIDDDSARAAVAAGLREVFAAALGAAEVVTDLAVFHQPDRTTPFRLIHRAAFGGAYTNGLLS